MPSKRILKARPNVALAAIVGLCVGLPVLSAVVTGSIHIPHNDDWAYFRTVFHLAENGDLEFVGWTVMTFVGQLLWAAPLAELFGRSLPPIVLANAVISAAGLLMTYSLARRFLGSSYALLVVLSVGIFPGFVVLVPTFMTDPAAYTAQMGCLLLGLRALDRGGRGRLVLLIASLIAGLYAFSVREFAIAAPLAVLISLFFQEKQERASSSVSVVGFGGLIVGSAALYLWRHSFSGSSPQFLGFQLGGDLLIFLAQAFFTLSMGLIPVVLFLTSRDERAAGRVINFGWLIAALLLIITLFSSGVSACCADGPASVFLGNLLTERGVLGNQVLPGKQPTLFPLPIWWILSAAAVVSGAMFAGRLHSSFSQWKWVRPQSPVLMVAAFGVLHSGAVIFWGILGGPIFDRYLIPPLLVVSVLLLRARTKPARVWNPGTVASTALLGAVSFVLVSSGHAFDVARWKAAEIAVSSGVPAQDVDGGFEWVGFHYEGAAQSGAPNRPLDPGPGYLDLFPRAGNCAIVTSSPAASPQLDLIDSVPYRSLLGLRTHRVWVYRFARACTQEGLSS